MSTLSTPKLFNFVVNHYGTSFRLPCKVEERIFITVLTPENEWRPYRYLNPYIYCQEEDLKKAPGHYFTHIYPKPPTTYQIISRNPFFLLSLVDIPTDIRKSIYKKIFDLFASEIQISFFRPSDPGRRTWFDIYSENK